MQRANPSPRQCLQCLRVKLVMDLLDGIGVTERDHRRLVAFSLGLLDESGVHLLELVALAVDGRLKVLLRVLHATHDPQVGMGVNGFSRSSRTEQLGDLRCPSASALAAKARYFRLAWLSPANAA